MTEEVKNHNQNIKLDLIYIINCTTNEKRKNVKKPLKLGFLDLLSSFG